MKRKLIILLVITIAMMTACRNNENKVADLIISNARIWTGNNNQPYVEALAVSGDKILAVGSNREMMRLKGKNTVVSKMHGEFIVPGFIDSHVHFLQGGENLASVQLRDASTPEEFIKRIGDFARTKKPGTWILGGDWDGKGWGDLPSRSWIDSVTPDNPVFLSRLDGHMALANSAALDLSGITSRVRDIAGGSIVRDSKGELTGILKDNAMNIVSDHIPPASAEETDTALVAAMRYFASNGITSVHAVDASAYRDAIERLKGDGMLTTRVYIMEPLGSRDYQTSPFVADDKDDNMTKSGGVKGFVDGSLGSHTAAFLEPYSDLESDSGLFVNSKEELYRWISQADAAGYQPLVHAIGDRAINFLLNTYETVERENGERDRRFRIEHAQHITPTDIPRFGELKVIASMQPYHAIDDGRWAEPLIGSKRAETTYAFRSLIDNGAVLAFGSDWPVAPATPLEGIYAATTRRTLDGKNPGGWVPEQKITVEEALKAYTINAAYASFDENIKGTLEPGKLADFTVLSDDILSIEPEKIADTKVLRTYLGGKKIFDINN